MHARTNPGFLAVLPALVITGVLSAHGGQYRGPAPAEQLPPAPTSPPQLPVASPPAPFTPPKLPTPAPGSRGPLSGGAPVPGVPGGPRTPRGIPLAEDLTRWQLWWEMNKDRYLLLRERQAGPQGPVTGDDEWYLGATRRAAKPILPGAARVARDTIVPALHRALVDTNDPHLVTACLIALAKIGEDHRDFALLDVLVRYLPARFQQTRETAALALGITRRAAALPLLRDLLLDNATGRKLARRSEVDGRVRAFAAYGIGILAAHGGVDLKAEAFAVLDSVLHDAKVWDRDIKVAAISALGVMRLDPRAGAKHKLLLWKVVPSLDKFYRAELGKAAQLVQAHVPVAVGRLLGRGAGVDAARFRERFRDELFPRVKRGPEIHQSAAIALGLLGRPADTDVGDALQRYHEFGRDQQAWWFSTIALGEIGGDANRTRLLSLLTRGRKATERPWAGLALGVLTYRARTATPTARADSTVGVALLEQLRVVKNKEAAGAFAIALGLCGHREAAPVLRARLVEERHHDGLAGAICTGLALLGDRKACGVLRSVMMQSVRRPELLRQAAVALGCLRDRQAVRDLLDLIGEDNRNTARMAAVAGALQMIGDESTLAELLKRLRDRDLTTLSRAFVAAALGGIGDPQPIPFNARYAMDSNYRAVVPTLTDQATGILDLL
ncbi:MAG: hypothetical protein KDC87_11560 [Planctomycetes bacterium]|nr:hypothetical protein [Planctomycetota bacterium]MCB9870204.1 hypothetical protein [Planctomycetota bacterium]